MRKKKEVTITAEGRDNGKTFVLTEMSADKAERWALRALFAMANAGKGDADPFAGMASLAVAVKQYGELGLLAALRGLHYDDVAPLLDEMMPCIQFKTPSGVMMAILSGDACQIEEVQTRWLLRMELIELHLGFSLAAGK